MIATLRARNFALLWWGGLISLTGDWMLRTALPFYVYDLTGSALATSVMFMVGTVPSLLLGPVAGVFVDRWDRRRTLVVSNLLLALTLTPLLLVRAADWLWLVYTVALVQSTLVRFVVPAENALLPLLVSEEQRLSANALNALNNNLARLVGPALGGLAVASLGLGGVALLDAASFLAAAGMVAAIRTGEEPKAPSLAEPGSAARKVWAELVTGVSLIRRDRTLTALFALTALMSFGEGVMAALFVPFVARVVGGSALELGWLMSAQAVGGILGGVAIAQLGARARPELLLGPSAVLFGLIDLAIFNAPTLIPGVLTPLVLFVLVGLPAAALGASMTTILQTIVADRYRGRVFAALGTLSALLVLAGLGIGGVGGDRIGIVPVLNIQGYVHVLAGLLAPYLLGMQVTGQANEG